MNIVLENENSPTLSTWKKAFKKQIEIEELERLVREYPDFALEILLLSKTAIWVADKVEDIIKAGKKRDMLIQQREELRIIKYPQQPEILVCQYHCKK